MLSAKLWLKYYYKFIKICDIPQWVANILKVLQPSTEYIQLSLLLAFLTKRFYPPQGLKVFVGSKTLLARDKYTRKGSISVYG